MHVQLEGALAGADAIGGLASVHNRAIAPLRTVNAQTARGGIRHRLPVAGPTEFQIEVGISVHDALQGHRVALFDHLGRGHDFDDGWICHMKNPKIKSILHISVFQKR